MTRIAINLIKTKNTPTRNYENYNKSPNNNGIRCQLAFTSGELFFSEKSEIPVFLNAISTITLRASIITVGVEVTHLAAIATTLFIGIIQYWQPLTQCAQASAGDVKA